MSTQLGRTSNVTGPILSKGLVLNMNCALGCLLLQDDGRLLWYLNVPADSEEVPNGHLSLLGTRVSYTDGDLLRGGNLREDEVQYSTRVQRQGYIVFLRVFLSCCLLRNKNMHAYMQYYEHCTILFVLHEKMQTIYIYIAREPSGLFLRSGMLRVTRGASVSSRMTNKHKQNL